MKAILVIDIPNDIWANKEEDLGMYAEVWSKRIDDGWCGEYHTDDLKPMPQKKIHIPKLNIWEITEEDKEIMIENRGYNKCIDDILGDIK